MRHSKVAFSLPFLPLDVSPLPKREYLMTSKKITLLIGSASVVIFGLLQGNLENTGSAALVLLWMGLAE